MQPTRGNDHDKDGNPFQAARNVQFDRRTLLKYSPGLAALALPGVQRGPIPSGAAPSGGSTSRIQTVSSQAAYTLPQDHQWHGGGIYVTGQLQEWHYWTGYLTDDDTGEEFGLFYNSQRAASATSSGGFVYLPYFSVGNLKTQDFTWTSPTIATPLVTGAPVGSTSPYDFQYSAQDANASFTTTYLATPDTWSLQFQGAAANASGPMALDLQVSTATPYGYLPVTPTGMENENAPWNGQQPDPSTMYSLSYYYAAPKSPVKGTVTVGNRVRRMTGSLWMEHQWGNFLAPQFPWAFSYIWSAYQFNDGSVFSFRQWYDQALNPLYNLNRYNYSTPDGNTTYGFGDAVQWQGLQTWQSPITGRNLPLYGMITTPFGTWYHSPYIESYEIPNGYPPYGTNGADFWEGPCMLHTGSLNGPVVGKAFVELPNNLTKTFPPLTGGA